MNQLTITIPGILPGKQRARGRNFYTPEKTVNAEAWVRHCAVQQIGTPRLEGPLEMCSLAYLRRPTGASGWTSTRAS